MPARAARASHAPTALAPDGIAIHTFALPPAAFVGIAEGRIPPGRFAIHRHLSLEQFTYVLRGRLTAITADAAHPTGAAVALQAGDLLLTLPGESLQFVNDGPDEARVLFICAPPYPQDDADTRVVEAHAHRHADGAAVRRRLETVRAALNAVIDARLAELARD
jgi:mannose-6-phosphate isomerase-like protein (cupin superfamily)